MSGTLGGVGAFHLGEQAEEHDGQVVHGVTGLGGVDGDGVGEGAQADAGLSRRITAGQEIKAGLCRDPAGRTSNDAAGFASCCGPAQLLP